VTDLSQFANLISAQEEGVLIDILHPVTGDPIGMKIKVAGPDSERVKSARQAVTNANLRANPANKPKAADLEASARKVTAAAVISWGGAEENGKPVECTVDGVLRVFTDYPFIYEQVSAVVGNRALFA
jgi:hypothetical protein